MRVLPPIKSSDPPMWIEGSGPPLPPAPVQASRVVEVLPCVPHTPMATLQAFHQLPQQRSPFDRRQVEPFGFHALGIVGQNRDGINHKLRAVHVFRRMADGHGHAHFPQGFGRIGFEVVAARKSVTPVQTAFSPARSCCCRRCRSCGSACPESHECAGLSCKSRLFEVFPRRIIRPSDAN